MLQRNCVPMTEIIIFKLYCANGSSESLSKPNYHKASLVESQEWYLRRRGSNFAEEMESRIYEVLVEI